MMMIFLTPYQEVYVNIGVNMNIDRLKDSVKQHEGYRNKVYLATLGKRTVGVGHLCVEDFWEDDKEYSEKFLLEILERF